MPPNASSEATCPRFVRPDKPRTSGRNPRGVRDLSALPDPTRPDPSRSRKEETPIDSLVLVARDERQLGTETDDLGVLGDLEGVV